MRIIIDADACPSVSKITSIAKEYNVDLFLYTDFNHNIASEYGKVIVVDQGYQSVDMYISNMVTNNDVVVTQDYGLALICLSKEAQVIHPNGFIYDDDNIDKMMFERHLSSQQRIRSKRVKGPKKRTKEDEDLLINNLVKILSNN